MEESKKVSSKSKGQSNLVGVSNVSVKFAENVQVICIDGSRKNKKLEDNEIHQQYHQKRIKGKNSAPGHIKANLQMKSKTSNETVSNASGRLPHPKMTRTSNIQSNCVNNDKKEVASICDSKDNQGKKIEESFVNAGKKVMRTVGKNQQKMGNSKTMKDKQRKNSDVEAVDEKIYDVVSETIKQIKNDCTQQQLKDHSAKSVTYNTRSNLKQPSEGPTEPKRIKTTNKTIEPLTVKVNLLEKKSLGYSSVSNKSIKLQSFKTDSNHNTKSSEKEEKSDRSLLFSFKANKDNKRTMSDLESVYIHPCNEDFWSSGNIKPGHKDTPTGLRNSKFKSNAYLGQGEQDNQQSIPVRPYLSSTESYIKQRSAGSFNSMKQKFPIHEKSEDPSMETKKTDTSETKKARLSQDMQRLEKHNYKQHIKITLPQSKPQITNLKPCVPCEELPDQNKGIMKNHATSAQLMDKVDDPFSLTVQVKESKLNDSHCARCQRHIDHSVLIEIIPKDYIVERGSTTVIDNRSEGQGTVLDFQNELQKQKSQQGQRQLKEFEKSKKQSENVKNEHKTNDRKGFDKAMSDKIHKTAQTCILAQQSLACSNIFSVLDSQVSTCKPSSGSDRVQSSCEMEESKPKKQMIDNKMKPNDESCSLNTTKSKQEVQVSTSKHLYLSQSKESSRTNLETGKNLEQQQNDNDESSLFKILGEGKSHASFHKGPFNPNRKLQITLTDIMANTNNKTINKNNSCQSKLQTRPSEKDIFSDQIVKEYLERSKVTNDNDKKPYKEKLMKATGQTPNLTLKNRPIEVKTNTNLKMAKSRKKKFARKFVNNLHLKGLSDIDSNSTNSTNQCKNKSVLRQYLSSPKIELSEKRNTTLVFPSKCNTEKTEMVEKKNSQQSSNPKEGTYQQFESSENVDQCEFSEKKVKLRKTESKNQRKGKEPLKGSEKKNSLSDEGAERNVTKKVDQTKFNDTEATNKKTEPKKSKSRPENAISDTQERIPVFKIMRTITGFVSCSSDVEKAIHDTQKDENELEKRKLGKKSTQMKSGTENQKEKQKETKKCDFKMKINVAEQKEALKAEEGSKDKEEKQKSDKSKGKGASKPVNQKSIKKNKDNTNINEMAEKKDQIDSAKNADKSKKSEGSRLKVNAKCSEMASKLGTKKTITKLTKCICPVCYQRFGTISELRLHKKEMHPFLCHKCGLELKDKASKTTHWWTHVSAAFKCEQCDVKFVSEKPYLNHLSSQKHAKVALKRQKTEQNRKQEELLDAVASIQDHPTVDLDKTMADLKRFNDPKPSAVLQNSSSFVSDPLPKFKVDQSISSENLVMSFDANANYHNGNTDSFSWVMLVNEAQEPKSFEDVHNSLFVNQISTTESTNLTGSYTSTCVPLSLCQPTPVNQQENICWIENLQTLNFPNHKEPDWQHEWVTSSFSNNQLFTDSYSNQSVEYKLYNDNNYVHSNGIPRANVFDNSGNMTQNKQFLTETGSVQVNQKDFNIFENFQQVIQPCEPSVSTKGQQVFQENLVRLDQEVQKEMVSQCPSKDNLRDIDNVPVTNSKVCVETDLQVVPSSLHGSDPADLQRFS